MKIEGFTLLEVLLAIALSGLVIAGLLMIYLSVKANNNLQKTWTDLQESGRFATFLLNQRLQLAGWVGCINSENPVNQTQAIIGYDSDHLPQILQSQVVSGTDAVVINSCVGKLQQTAYFIGDTHRKNSQGQPILGLFQKPLDSDREELIAGVEQMQIIYGVTAASTAEQVIYFPAIAITDWNKVRSVEIDLLLNSIEPALTAAQNYYFHGVIMTATDRLLHKPWSLYITLRER